MEGKPVEYNFRFLYHFQGLLPWLVLIGVSLALKENRKAEILWILVPLTMVWLLFVLGKRMMGLPSSAHVELNMMRMIKKLLSMLLQQFAPTVGRGYR